MNKRIVSVLTVILMGVLLSGCSLLDNTADGPEIEAGFQVATELSGTPSAQGDDQKQLENEQKIDPKDDELDTIESEVNSTVILKEDFSNL